MRNFIKCSRVARQLTLVFILLLSSLNLPAPAMNNYIQLDRVVTNNDQIDLSINKNTTVLDLNKTRNIRIRVKAKKLYNSVERVSSFKVSMYEVDGSSRNFIGSQQVTLFKGIRRSRVISLDAGNFKSSRKNVEFDLYDTEGRLVNTYRTELQAVNLNAQPAGDIGFSLDSAQCDNSSFGECQMDYIVQRLQFEARPQRQATTRTTKSSDGLYKVTVPYPRTEFKVLRRKNRRKVSPGGDGSTGGGTGDGGLVSQFGTIIDVLRVNYGFSPLENQFISYEADGNLNFNDNAFLDLFGKLGIGVEDPTAWLHVRQGNPLVPSIKINPGPLTNQPQDGAIEYDGTNLYFTNGTNRFPIGAGSGTGNGSGLGDNLGNHVATQHLNMADFNIGNVDKLTADKVETEDFETINFITGTLNVVGPARVGGQFRLEQGAQDGFILQSDANGKTTWVDPLSVVTVGDNLGNHTASQDLDMANNDIINVNGLTASSINANTITANDFIGGDFTGDNVNVTQVNASVINGDTFIGDGSGLTNVNLDNSSTVNGATITNATIDNSTINNSNLNNPFLEDAVLNGKTLFTQNYLAKFNGELQFVDGNEAAGKVLTSDAAGSASWQTLIGVGVNGTASGNLGGIQFSDGNDGFAADANNLFWDDVNKRLGVGTDNPSEDFEVDGTAKADEFIGNSFNGGTFTGTFVGDGSGLTGVPGDNLGNHTATTDLNVNLNDILDVNRLDVITIDASTVNATNFNGGTFTGTFVGDGSGLTGAGDDLGNHTATQALDMAGENIINAGNVNLTNTLNIASTADGGINFNGVQNGFKTLITTNNVNSQGTPLAEGFRFVVDDSLISADRDYYVFDKTDYNSPDPDGGFVFMNTGNDGIAEVALAIQGNNRVGVGILVPQAALHVNGGIIADTFNGTFIGDGSGLTGVGATASGGAGGVQFSDGAGGLASDEANFFWDDAANRLGIGTQTPGAALEVNGTALIGKTHLNTTAIGLAAGTGSNSANSNFIGYTAGTNSTGGFINALGYGPGQDQTGSFNNLIGYATGRYNSGSQVNAIGHTTAHFNNGNNLNAMGPNAAEHNEGTNVNAFGNRAAQNNAGNSVNALGAHAAANNTSHNVNAFGPYAGESNLRNNLNAIGYFAARYNNGVYLNTIGYQASTNNEGDQVNSMGNLVTNNNTGNYVNALGSYTAEFNKGDHVDAFGFRAARYNSGTGIIAIGREALYVNNGNYNIALGYQAGNSLNSGSENILIGRGVQAIDNDADHQINIANTIYGNSNDGEIALGRATNNPKATLEVNGSFVFTNGTETNGYILTTDAAGNATWASAGSISGMGDDLGNHTATTDLNVNYHNIFDVNNIDVAGTVFATTISGTNFNGGTFTGTFVGDGSGLTGVGGNDNLGNHTATQNLDMGNHDINNVADLNTIQDVNVGNNLNVDGDAVFDQNVAVNGNTSVDGALTVTGISYQDKIFVTNNVNGDKAYFNEFHGTFVGDGSGLTGVGASASGGAGGVQFSDGAGNLDSDDANFFWDDTNKRLGIGDNNPGAALDVEGSVTFGFDRTNGGSAVGFASSMNNTGDFVHTFGSHTGMHNVGHRLAAFGYNTAASNNGDNVSAIGQNTAYNNTGDHVQAMGLNAARDNTGSNINALGVSAARHNEGLNVNAFGQNAANYNKQDFVNAIGSSAGYQNNGVGLNAIGSAAGQYNDGDYVNALGNQAARYNQGNYVVAIGHKAADNNSGYGTIAIGHEAAQDANGNYNIAIGHNAASQLDTGAFNIAIGPNVNLPDPNVNNQLNIGNTIYGKLSDGEIALGRATNDPKATLEVNGSFVFTNGSETNGYILTTDATGNATWASAASISGMGDNLGNHTATQNLNLDGHTIMNVGTLGANFVTAGQLSIEGPAVIGENALFKTAIGNAAGQNNTGINVVALGQGAAQDNHGYKTIAIGNFAGRRNNGEGLIALGYRTAIDNTGVYNTAIGREALEFAAGNYNLGLGYRAGRNVDGGSQNITIGTNTDVVDPNANYQINIGNTIYGNSNTGEIALGKVTNNPSATLELNGSFAYTDGSQANGYVLSSDAAGNASWVSPASLSGAGDNLGNHTASQDLNMNSHDILGLGDITANSFTGGTFTGTGLTIEGSSVLGNSTIHATYVGEDAGLNNTQEFVTLIGKHTGRNNTGRITTALGYAAASQNAANGTIAIGRAAANENIGRDLTAVGDAAGYSNNGNFATILGYYSGRHNLGNDVVAIGTNAGQYNKGNDSVAIGKQAGRNNTGANLTAVGTVAAQANTGDFVTALGTNAATNNTKNEVVAIGRGAGENNNGETSIAIGAYAGRRNDGTQLIALGYRAGIDNTGSYNTAIGRDTLEFTTGNYNIGLGYRAGRNIGGGGHNITVGPNTNVVNPNGNYQLNIGNTIYGNTNTGEIALGRATNNPSATLEVNGSFNYSDGSEVAGHVLTTDATGNATWVDPATLSGVGDNLGNHSATQTLDMNAHNIIDAHDISGNDFLAASYNGYGLTIHGQSELGDKSLESTYIGEQTGSSNTGTRVTGIGWRAITNNTANYAVGIGSQTARNNTGLSAIGIGTSALFNNKANQAIGIGQEAGYWNNGAHAIGIGIAAAKYNNGNYLTAVGPYAGTHNEGYNNSFFGRYAGYQNKGGHAIGIGYYAAEKNLGAHTVAVGTRALQNSNSNYNIGIGFEAGRYIENGHSNIMIGRDTDAINPNGNYQLNIGNTIYGNTNTDEIAIGRATNNPKGTLEVNGSLYYVDGNQTAGYVLQSDAAGKATWVDPASLGVGGNGGNLIAFRARNAGNSSIPNNVLFYSNRANTEDYDIGSAYDTGTGRFTAPVDGVYHFTGSAATGVSCNTGQFFLWFIKNRGLGSQQIFAGDADFAPGSNSAWCLDVDHSEDIYLNAGDYLEIRALTGAGGTNTLVSMEFTGHLVTSSSITGGGDSTDKLVVGTAATQLLNAGSQITADVSYVRVAGNGGAVTLTSNPQITVTGGAQDGQVLIIKGTDSVNTVTVVHGNGLSLTDGLDFTLGYQDTIKLVYDAIDGEWIEISRSDKL